jgi:hypothetical protein
VTEHPTRTDTIRVVTPDDRQFRRTFHNAIEDRPLEPDDPRYVELYGRGNLVHEDPVRLLHANIDLAASNQGVQLLSGFRGAGKSTELRRLALRLEEDGYIVLMFDIEDYIDPTIPLDISDFLMTVAGAFDDLVAERELVADRPGQSIWDRLAGFLKTRPELEEISASVLGVGLKVGLKNDPTFRQRLHERALGHIAALDKEVGDYLTSMVEAIRAENECQGIVLLVDSIEHVRGALVNTEEVQASLERLFSDHARRLHLPAMHVIYTVPPWLKVRVPAVSNLYSPGGLQMLYALKISEHGDATEPIDKALDALTDLVAARGDWQRLLGGAEVLRNLVLQSGGHLRDLLRMLREVLIRAEDFPVDDETVKDAIAQARRDYLPIADDNATWLDRIAQTGEPSLPDDSRLAKLASFLDTHLVLCYRNDGEWYDVHPLVREQIATQARAVREASAVPVEGDEAGAADQS